MGAGHALASSFHGTPFMPSGYAVKQLALPRFAQGRFAICDTCLTSFLCALNSRSGAIQAVLFLL
jgi:hypothetical protein